MKVIFHILTPQTAIDVVLSLYSAVRAREDCMQLPRGIKQPHVSPLSLLDERPYLWTSWQTLVAVVADNARGTVDLCYHSLS